MDFVGEVLNLKKEKWVGGVKARGRFIMLRWVIFVEDILFDKKLIKTL